MTLIPVACTTSAKAQGFQLGQWESLIDEALASERLVDGLRVVLPEQQFGTVAALVERETQCCAWATWSAELSKEGVVVEVRSDQGEGVATIHLMFASLIVEPHVETA